MLKVLVAHDVHRAADEVFRKNNIKPIRTTEGREYDLTVREAIFDGVCAVFASSLLPAHALAENLMIKAIGCTYQDLRAVDGEMLGRRGLPVITSYEGDDERAARAIAQSLCDFLHLGKLAGPVANKPKTLRHRIDYPALRN